MLGFDGRKSIRTFTPITSTTGNYTIRLLTYIESVSDQTVIFDSDSTDWADATRGILMTIEADGKLGVYRKGTTYGHWVCPITTGRHILTVAMLCDGDEAQNPTVYIDGVAQTMTENLTPVAQNTMANVAYYFYFGARGDHAIPFKGYITEIAIWKSIVTAAAISIMDKAWSKRACLQFSPDEVWDLGFNDQWSGVGTGEAFTNLTSVATSDVTYTWSTAAPGYAQIDADDGGYIKANKDDDNETITFGMGAVTVPTGMRIWELEVLCKITCTDVTVYPQISLSATGVTCAAKNVIPTSTAQQVVSLVWRSPTTAGWSAADLANMTMSIKSPTMSSTTEFQVYYTPIIYYANRGCRSMTSSNVLTGRSALSAPQRQFTHWG